MAEKIMQGIKQISELIGQAVKKRVVCLYRVSTVGQVEKDDIPMQKQYCREFCRGQSGWEIVKEFSEKGVSGFKVSAKDRDAIQEIQKMALKGEFDILLVFMFDRLGRRDDETPFVVEWFVKQGIEVWSAMEGQQRFDTHVDKLLNYIRYWQASGESPAGKNPAGTVDPGRVLYRRARTVWLSGGEAGPNQQEKSRGPRSCH